MFSGAQISLYPMSDDFVGVITNALDALETHRDRLRIETDDISTLLVGVPEVLFASMRDLTVSAAETDPHVVLSATISRGCPGEPDDPICAVPEADGPLAPLKQRQAGALLAVTTAPVTGRTVTAQFSLYVMGTGHHMDEIYGCIDFLKQCGVFERSKNFCTKVSGDAGAVFAAVEQAFAHFGPPGGHVTVDLTVSANSPTVF